MAFEVFEVSSAMFEGFEVSSAMLECSRGMFKVEDVKDCWGLFATVNLTSLFSVGGVEKQFEEVQ